MNWTTNVNFPLVSKKIEHRSKLLFLGSCFSENIGNKLREQKFNITVNPLGIYFNPVSIFNLAKPFQSSPESYVTHSELYFNYHFHSKVNAKSNEALELKIKQLSEQFTATLNDTEFVVLTFGTAIVHEHHSSKQVVANCHKQPSLEFNKRFLNIEEINSAFANFKEKEKLKNTEKIPWLFVQQVQ